jgi:flavin-dependent dehydrogenase
MTIAATLSLWDAARTIWDAMSVGAGPAGALVAHELGRRGARTLLVDRAAFPRWKVCGCCLLEPGLRTLREVGLGGLPELADAVPLTSVRFAARRSQALVPLQGGVAISREALDTALVHAALSQGVHFLPETVARSQQDHSELREIILEQSHQAMPVRARVVVSAEGLGSHLFGKSSGISIRVRRSSRVGVGCTFPAPENACPNGIVSMACGRAGYAGLVRLRDGRVNCAAALDIAAIRRATGPGAAVTSIFREAGLNVPAELASASWRGTTALSRSLSRHAARRLFIVGDAAGYLEPFTGEGMSLALSSARAVAPLAFHASQLWEQRLGRTWEAKHARIVSANRRFLDSMSLLLRYPRVAGWIVAVLSVFPALAVPIARRINGPRASI